MFICEIKSQMPIFLASYAVTPLACYQTVNVIDFENICIAVIVVYVYCLLFVFLNKHTRVSTLSITEKREIKYFGQMWKNGNYKPTSIVSIELNAFFFLGIFAMSSPHYSSCVRFSFSSKRLLLKQQRNGQKMQCHRFNIAIQHIA